MPDAPFSPSLVAEDPIYLLEDSHVPTHRRENLKSYQFILILVRI
jgi:hypothetical protein